MSKHSRAEFIRILLPIARQARADGSPMFVSVRLAQNILETGCVIHPWYNLGGIKVGSGQPNQWWDGSSVNKATYEVYNGAHVNTRANFRAYKSIYDFYRDQDRLLSNSRYSRVRTAKTPAEQCHALLACGYATDPIYAVKLIQILDAENLEQYDEEEETLKLTQSQKTMMINALKKLSAAGTIGAEWVEKAEKGDLTTSDLAWLNLIILARK